MLIAQTCSVCFRSPFLLKMWTGATCASPFVTAHHRTVSRWPCAIARECYAMLIELCIHRSKKPVCCVATRSHCHGVRRPFCCGVVEWLCQTLPLECGKKICLRATVCFAKWRRWCMPFCFVTSFLILELLQARKPGVAPSHLPAAWRARSWSSMSGGTGCCWGDCAITCVRVLDN